MSGVLLHDMRGEHGFGYDPVVFLPALQKSVAELLPDEKNKISHRAQAMQQLVKQLAEKL
jgi:XTP/dITP diphosphohydrolase